MYIVMLLNGEEVSRNKLFPNSRISKEMEELRNKYRKEIEKAGTEPKFCIEGAPSAINRFKSPLEGALD